MTLPTLRGNPAARRAVGLVLLAVVLSTACVFLGRWQWHRHVARDAAIRLVEQNYSAGPVPLADLLPAPGAALDPGDVWRQATATGTYDADAAVLLRNRPVDSQPGFHVLVPLELADGSVLVVDRGWVAWDDDASGEVSVPAPPAGEVTVTVHLRPDEPASTRSAPAGQVQAIHVAQVLDAGGVDAESYGAYGGVVDERPAAATALGALPAPSTDPGSHLSYAFQWWTFAVGGLVAFAWLARRELLEGAAEPDGDGPDDPDRPARPAPPAPPRRRRPSDEETEDALIDSQLG
ncbi:SURF1 family protein [Cellulomonas hominis]|uniref:SURF1 family cytochrome oxidase biogenesis protein n=1 Tax=Cellulomonas hominis TaxID=156981 RepID=UPI001C111E91|nr:SURF1 family protein [Cellulomonas hominis]MBU5424475.1 SURF1 family protein [Cellulomonas hominis]